MLKKLPGLTLALVSAMAGAAAHADTGPTREQVQAETLAAIHNGDMVMPSGMTPRSMFPDRYPAASAPAGPTREQVQAETAAAIRNGDMVMPSGMTPRSMFPDRYAAAPVAAGPTRSQVQAETLAAIRNGDMVAASGMTARALTPGRYPPPAPAVAQLPAAGRKGDTLATGRPEPTMGAQ